jgi:hypothetical protein
VLFQHPARIRRTCIALKCLIGAVTGEHARRLAIGAAIEEPLQRRMPEAVPMAVDAGDRPRLAADPVNPGSAELPTALRHPEPFVCQAQVGGEGTLGHRADPDQVLFPALADHQNRDMAPVDVRQLDPRALLASECRIEQRPDLHRHERIDELVIRRRSCEPHGRIVTLLTFLYEL